MQVMLAVAAADFSEGAEKFWKSIEEIFAKHGPQWASPKLDGIRAAEDSGVIYSRKWKPIKNEHIQKVFGKTYLHGLDGELIMGSPTDPNVIQRTTSAVNSIKGEPLVDYYVFDAWSIPGGFERRYQALKNFESYAKEYGIQNIHVVPQILVHSAEELKKQLYIWLGQGYEGAMIRSQGSPYKNGRSTQKEAYLLKVKLWEDSEAIIEGVFEGTSNTNEQTIDETGHAKRSSHKDGMVPNGMLGTLVVRDLTSGVQFDIGRAVKGVWNQQDLVHLWGQRAYLMGKIIKYRFFPSGVKDKPRFPQFICFRDIDDL